jgi:hypothetical protein
MRSEAEKAKPKAPTAEEKRERVKELQRLLVAGVGVLYEAGAGSYLDAAKECLSSEKGAEIARELRSLGFVVDARSLAQAGAASSR